MGGGVSAEQLNRFGMLECISDMNKSFPDFDAAAFAVTHDGAGGTISVAPASPSAENDVRGFAFALHAMLCDFDRNEEAISFACEGMDDELNVLVCTSYNWALHTPEVAEATLRQLAKQRDADAKLMAECEEAYGQDDNDFSPM